MPSIELSQSPSAGNFAANQAPSLAELRQKAELVIRRVSAEVWTQSALTELLERAYPFGNLEEGREVWKQAIRKHMADLERERFCEKNYRTSSIWRRS